MPACRPGGIPVAVRGHHLLYGVAAVALCAWCGWVSAYHRTTVAAEVTWVLSLGAVLVVDVALWRGKNRRRFGWHLEPVDDPWPRPGREGGRLALRGVAPWILLFALALAWDVLALDTGPHEYHLTISALAQAYRPLNAALLLVWIAAGIGYVVARVRAPVHSQNTSGSLVETDPDTPAPSALGAGMLSGGGHPFAPALFLPSSPPVGLAFWVALPILVIVVDQSARRSHGRVANGEELIRFISKPTVANVVLIGLWVLAGYHLFAR